MKLYVSTGFANHRFASAVMAELFRLGHVVTYDWTIHAGPDAPRLSPGEIAGREAHGVQSADAVVMLLPGGVGTHTEFGMARALRKDVVLFASELQFYGPNRPRPDTPSDHPSACVCPFYHAAGVHHFDLEMPMRTQDVKDYAGYAASVGSLFEFYRQGKEAGASICIFCRKALPRLSTATWHKRCQPRPA